MNTAKISAEDDFDDHTVCPACAAAIKQPKSTRYLGLGRIEHQWQCHRCGDSFLTGTRMAGLIELEAPAVALP